MDEVETTEESVSWRVYLVGQDPLVIDEDVPWSRLLQSTSQGGVWIRVNDTLLINPAQITHVERL